MKHVFLSIFFALSLALASAEIPFSFDWRLDAPLFAIGATQTALSMAIPKWKNYENLSNEKGNLDDVNALDRWAAHGYKKGFDRAGDVVVAFSLVSPAAIFGATWLSDKITTNDALVLAAMYAESFLLTQGTCGLLKIAIKRDRPFMYYDERDSSAITDGDGHFSFPSSHTANAFMSATFLTYTFCEIFPESPWKIPVAIGGYSLAVAVGALRIASANHFPTDVFSGAVIGTIFGFAVPFSHTFFSNSKSTSQDSKKVEVSILPLGFSLKFKS